MITVKTRDGDAPSVFEVYPGDHSWEVTREKTLEILAPDGGTVAEYRDWQKVYWSEDTPATPFWQQDGFGTTTTKDWSGSASI